MRSSKRVVDTTDSELTIRYPWWLHPVWLEFELPRVWVPVGAAIFAVSAAVFLFTWSPLAGFFAVLGLGISGRGLLGAHYSPPDE
jgi:hypothetical protein